MEEKILEFVEDLQADSYKEGISWKGFKVYIPEYKNNPVIGLPYVILVKGEEVRLSTAGESLDYLDYCLSQDKKTKMKELVLLAKTKEGYTKDTVMNIICICCSEQMYKSGYTSVQALEQAINFIKEGYSTKELYSELLKMTGDN